MIRKGSHRTHLKKIHSTDLTTVKVVRDAFAAQVVDEGWSGNYFDYCKKVLIADKSATGWRLMIKSAKSPTSLVHQSETEAQIEERFKRITQRSMKQFRKPLRTTHVVVRFDNDEPADEEIGSSSDDDEWLLEKSMQVLGDDESALDLPSDSSESEYGLCGRPVANREGVGYGWCAQPPPPVTNFPLMPINKCLHFSMLAMDAGNAPC